MLEVKVGCNIELTKQWCLALNLKWGRGIIYGQYPTHSPFPYWVYLEYEDYKGQVSRTTIPLHRNEFIFTNLPLSQEMEDWKKEHI